VIEYLPYKCKDLSSKPTMTKNGQRKLKDLETLSQMETGRKTEQG
jgi:hypothetical protein